YLHYLWNRVPCIVLVTCMPQALARSRTMTRLASGKKKLRTKDSLILRVAMILLPKEVHQQQRPTLKPRLCLLVHRDMDRQFQSPASLG
ncbi:hypothetical protein DFQ27_002463, partial [Actinomortierella ambigua]